MSPFRVFGGFVLAFGILALVVVVANLGRGSLGGHSLVPFIGAALLSVLIGFGLLFHHKWAAVLFAVILASTGLWMIIMSTLRVPMTWLILNVGIGCVLLVPSLIVVRRWPELNRR